MTIVYIIGTRPNFVKMAPVIAELRRLPGARHVIVHTGQHSPLPPMWDGRTAGRVGDVVISAFDASPVEPSSASPGMLNDLDPRTPESA